MPSIRALLVECCKIMMSPICLRVTEDEKLETELFAFSTGTLHNDGSLKFIRIELRKCPYDCKRSIGFGSKFQMALVFCLKVLTKLDYGRSFTFVVVVVGALHR